MENSNFLTVDNLEVIYTSNDEIVRAVNGVSFSMKKGEALGLVGETGAGKTTVAKSILRILPNPPAKVLNGKITLDGASIFDISDSQMLKIRGDKAAMIFQDPMTALNPLMTVGEQIAESVILHNKNISKKDAYKHAGDMLEVVDIPRERFMEYPHQFSGGMKQRVVIAMALACNPELLLADEPTTALDVTIQAQVLELINNLRKERGTSLILITHDLGVVAEVCDTVAVMYAGQIVEYGTKRQIFKETMHPYTKGLFDSLPKLGSGSKRLSPIKGLPPDPTKLPQGCAFGPRCPWATDECTTSKIDIKDFDGHIVRCLKAGR